jgi:putative NADH-flavin reductase
MKKNVLLIGATGYVGKALLNELLNRGHQVTAVVRSEGKLNDSRVETVVGDVTNPDTLATLAKGKDAVISAYNPGGPMHASTRTPWRTIRRSLQVPRRPVWSACSSLVVQALCLWHPVCA